MVGFLPPNNTNHVGEGFVSFSGGLKKELTTNATLKNKASIVFDANKPIITNEYVNTLDIDRPQSNVAPLKATSGSKFPVFWAGSDVGSGINSYSVFVLENDTALWVWKGSTKLETAEFEGKIGSNYKFYSIASDNVNLIETDPSGYDASTLITVGINERSMNEDALKIYPNPASDQFTLKLENAPSGFYVIEIFGLTGNVVHSEIYSSNEISAGINIRLSQVKAGEHIIRIISEKRYFDRKIIIN